jgi:vacuolar iron transporter family protein
MITEEQKIKVLKFQKDEMTSHLLYKQLAGLIKDKHNADVIREMSDTEMRHYLFWKKVSGTEIAPDRVKIFFLLVMTRLLGLTFSIKLIEQAEAAGAKEYAEFESVVSGAAQMGKDEEGHETAMAGMIQEEFLSYVGSIVLGLNDALVELTGTLAGLTFALQSGQLVVVSGLITGIAAAISMAASEYLSARADNVAKA